MNKLIGDIVNDKEYVRILIDTEVQQENFTKALHAVYRAEMTHEQFAQWIAARYPGHAYEMNFIVERLPR